jgi:hypothetical protein
VERTCEFCGDAFDAKRSTAKYCSATCRQRAKRDRAKKSAKESDAPEAPQGLVASVRRDLESAGRADTFAGQLALQLAKRLTDPAESGISAMSKELRTVMAAAMDGVIPPSAEEPKSPEAPLEEQAPPEDEVEKARRKREEARQAAGLA